MPINDQWINRKINENRFEDNKKHREAHEPSGKLSASMLFQPLRFQVLKTIGLPRAEFDAYTLGVFDKGNRVEARFVESMRRNGGIVEDVAVAEKHGLTWDKDKKQFLSVYRDSIGYVDAVANTDIMESKLGIMPWEVKSVTSYKYKHIKKAGGIDWHYQLQACQNALGMNSDYYGVVIISKEHDDPHVNIFRTRELKRDVDQIISRYGEAMDNWRKDRTLPKFEVDPRAKWAGNPKYAMYDEFYMTAPDSLVIKKLEDLRII